MTESVEITADSLARFFTEKGIDGKCPSCGKEEWDVVRLEDGIQPSLVGARHLPAQKRVEAIKTFPMLMIVCRHCFYVKLHTLIQVEQFIQRFGDANES